MVHGGEGVLREFDRKKGLPVLEFKHRDLFSYKFWQGEDIVRVYLDNCCYNRPFDNQNFLRISLETQAKLYIQKLIRDKKVELATS